MHLFKPTILLLALATLSPALELKPGEKGIHLDAGSLGSFELSYPAFSDGSKDIHPLVEARASGPAATLTYQGGATIQIATTASGEITFTLSGVTADVKTLTATILVDIAFSRGGTWKAGEKEGPFPREKATPPQFFSDNTSSVTIANASGDQLDLTLPPHTFAQLTDNREWNWPVYALKCFVPVNRDTTTLTFKISVTKGTGNTVVIDPFGQSSLEDWPAKLKTEDELKADIASDEIYYASRKTPSLDPFGGLPGSGRTLGFQKTGFFHIHQSGGKSYLVNPEGNLFFHTGVCSFQPLEDYTYVQGRENIYAWLPKHDDPAFHTAWRKDDPTSFSFYLANTIRKYGQPYDYETFAGRMIDRVRKFGFNSIGAFSAIPEAAVEKQFPYVLSLPLNKWETGIETVPGAHEVWDPFDEKTRSIIENTLADKLPARANDPLLIGYFVVNEPRYDELPKVIPSLNGDQACKRAFVDFLKNKYQDISAYNTAWNTTAATFDELIAKGLAVSTDAAKADAKAFTGIFLDELFKLVETNFRKHDKNHLLIGYRFQPITIKDRQLCEIVGKYVDVNSYNYYTHELDKEHLRQIHQWSGGKPVMLSEFFWSSPADSGLSGGRSVHSQEERGLIYRNYVEQAASLGFVIGIEWFTLLDQAATGRWFSKYTGESFNTGLFSVADRPWKPMLEQMAETNHTIYDVILGQRPPFAWEKAAILENQRR